MDKFQRLVVVSALHDGYRIDDYTEECHPATRARILEEMTTWVKQSKVPPILWFSGPAGAGKTAIVRSTCSILQDELNVPFAAIFFWKADSGRNTLQHLPATIAHQLYQSVRGLRPFIEQSINDDPMLLDRSFQKQMEKLVIDPLLALHVAGSITTHRIIILFDGLDECDADGQRQLLRFLPHLCSQLAPLLIGCFIATRPESSIYAEFQHPKLAAISVAKKLEASENDIKLFLIAEFEEINARHPYLRKKYGKWPSAEEFDILVKKSSGFFICPKTAIRYIDSSGKGLRPDDRLRIVVSAFAVDSWHEPIDKLYLAILNQHAPMADLECFKRRLGLLCLPALLWRSMAFEIDTHRQVSIVFQETLEDLRDSLLDLQSLFSLDGGTESAPLLNHSTFRDFLFSSRRSLEFYVDDQALHMEVVSKHLNHLYKQKFSDCSIHGVVRYSHGIAIIIRRHLEQVVPYTAEAIGHLIDDFSFDSIPEELNLLHQTYLLEDFIDPLHQMTAAADFPKGSARRVALESKVASFFNKRRANAFPGELELLALVCSPRLKFPECYFCHDTECIQRHLDSPHDLQRLEDERGEVGCTCPNADNAGKFGPYGYSDYSFSAKAIDGLLQPYQDRRIAQLALEALLYILSYPDRMLALWGFEEDDWICCLLRHCLPNKEMCVRVKHCHSLHVVLGSTTESESEKWEKSTLVPDLEDYLTRCREAGIQLTMHEKQCPDCTQFGAFGTPTGVGTLELGTEKIAEVLSEGGLGVPSELHAEEITGMSNNASGRESLPTATGISAEATHGDEGSGRKRRRWKDLYSRLVERVKDGLQ